MTVANTTESLALLKAGLQTPDVALTKAYTQSSSATSGITAYDLEPSAKLLVPTITPLRNIIPRVSGRGGIQANWRAITGINTSSVNIGVSEGNRGAITATSTVDYTAAYKGIGLEDNVSFEADYAAGGFDDVKSLATSNLLRALMIGEEKYILGGNNSIALGTAATPTVTDVATGGTLAAATAFSVIVVALTHEGFLGSSVVNGVALSANRTLADGAVESVSQGTSIKSAPGTVTTASDGNATHALKVSWAVKTGAVGYAVFWGAAGSETLGAVTTINSVVIQGAASGAQLASAGFTADKSRNNMAFDGLLTQSWASGSGSYVKSLATGTPGIGSTLTGDGAGGIVEIDVALQAFWDDYRLSPDTIWVSSQEQKNISAKVLAGNGNSAQRFSFNVDQGMIAGGVMVRSYLNKFSMDGAQEIPIKIHPNLPAGTILFTSASIPYPLSNVGNILQIRTRKEYYSLAWPQRTRRYEYGVYADEVLQNYFPPAFGVINNIANG
jgi:hypothetical protein